MIGLCACTRTGPLAACVKTLCWMYTRLWVWCRSNRARGFSYLPLTWGLGTVIAPFIGGVVCIPPPPSSVAHVWACTVSAVFLCGTCVCQLSEPAAKYPSYSWGLFKTYPYLMPSVVGVGIQALSLFIVVKYMSADPRGTRAALQQQRGASQACQPDGVLVKDKSASAGRCGL